uniref:Uncharacterized protein n=1 Tax=Cuerna arida TaxID=1464854 RepID=A0A1B6FW22_9HEMI
MKFGFQIFFCFLLFFKFDTGVSGELTAQSGPMHSTIGVLRNLFSNTSMVKLANGSSNSNEAEAEPGMYEHVREPRCAKPQHSPEIFRVEYVPNYMAPEVQRARKQQERSRQQPVHVLNYRPSPSDRWDRRKPASSVSKVVMPVQSRNVQPLTFNPERRNRISHPRSSLINRDGHVLRGNLNSDAPRGRIPVRNPNTGPTNYRYFQGRNSNSSVANQFRRPNYDQNRNFQSRIDTNKVRNVSVQNFNSGMPNRNTHVAQPKHNIAQNRSFVWPRSGYISQPNHSGKKPLVGDHQNGVQKQQQAYNPGVSSPRASRRYNIKVKPEVFTHINRPYKTLQQPQ